MTLLILAGVVFLIFRSGKKENPLPEIKMGAVPNKKRAFRVESTKSCDQCGQFTEGDSAQSAKDGSEQYYFCSSECLDANTLAFGPWSQP